MLSASVCFQPPTREASTRRSMFTWRTTISVAADERFYPEPGATTASRQSRAFPLGGMTGRCRRLRGSVLAAHRAASEDASLRV
jgi:hypothetical protein